MPSLALGNLDEFEHLLVLLFQQPELSTPEERGTLLADSDDLAVEVEDRVGVRLLLDVDGLVVVVGTHPWLGGGSLGEAAIGSRGPLNGCTSIVTTKLVDTVKRLLEGSRVVVVRFLTAAK